jgi:hypothetical protein
LFVLMGGAKLYVPRSVDVSVQSFIVMGGVNALGESSGGIISFAHEESQALRTAGGSVPQLEIQVFGMMGGVEVVQVDGPVALGGGLRANLNQQMLMASSYDRAAERSIRHAEHQAQRELRRQQRRMYD